MLNLLKNLRKRRHDLIVEESDIMSVLRVFDSINRNCRFDILMNMEIRNCCLVKEPTKWFISFESRDYKWKTIIKELGKKHFYIILKENGELYLVDRKD